MHSQSCLSNVIPFFVFLKPMNSLTKILNIFCPFCWACLANNNRTYSKIRLTKSLTIGTYYICFNGRYKVFILVISIVFYFPT